MPVKSSYLAALMGIVVLISSESIMLPFTSLPITSRDTLIGMLILLFKKTVSWGSDSVMWFSDSFSEFSWLPKSTLNVCLNVSNFS